MIRSSRIEDAAGIARIHVETWRAAYAGIMPADFLAKLSVENRTRQWDYILDQNARDVLVADDGPGMAGYCFSTLGRSGASSLRGEIMGLYVLPEFQGRGHGKELMVATEADLGRRGLREAVLRVLEANHASRTFYERRGYAHAGEAKPEVCGKLTLPVLRYRKRL
jgi:ribosomal protein S18 acetylase RimI-like enzyme